MSDQRDLSAEDRYAFVGLLHAVHQANDHSYARARSFRNIIMVAMVLLSLAAAGLVVAGSTPSNPDGWTDCAPSRSTAATCRPPSSIVAAGWTESPNTLRKLSFEQLPIRPALLR